jgi:CheY-like chemotaxis protein
MSDSRIPAGRALRVLHVDDEPLNRRLVADILAGCGHSGVEAQSGQEALDLLGCRPFDVVLMDIKMPGITGIEAVQRLRNSPGRARDTPVIALTAEVGRTTSDYLALGFNGFVAKPFRIFTLLEAIEACRRPESMPRIVRLSGPLPDDPTRRLETRKRARP